MKTDTRFRAQWIIDYGSRVLSALLVTPDGELLSCSQEIRQTAVRHIAAEIVFDERAAGDRPYSWEDAAASLTSANAHTLFSRARRLGVRRLWDSPDSGNVVHLRSPLTVLSSPAALADPHVSASLYPVAAALIDALIDPLVAFVTERGFAPEAIDTLVILPAHTGRRARLTLQRVLRRRGFGSATVVPRELAAAMALLQTASTTCQVWDLSDDDLHLHSVALERDGDARRLRTVQARTLRGFGRAFWISAMAAAFRERDEALGSPAALDRALTTLLTGTPQSSMRLNHRMLEEILDTSWQRRQRTELAASLQPALEEMQAHGPVLLSGDLCAIEAIRGVFMMLGATNEGVPQLERLMRNVATAALWLRADPLRRLIVHPSGGLRVNTLRGEAIELMAATQLPAAGEHAYVATQLRFAGEMAGERSFLLHLLWGADRVPEGNATLCALPIELGSAPRAGLPLRLAVQLGRSGSGHGLVGRLVAQIDGRYAARPRWFTEEFPLFPTARPSPEELS